MADSIGERIKALRSDQGLTLARLGEKTGLSTSYLSQIERDKTTPSLVTLTAIARPLNVGVRYFFETEVRQALAQAGLRAVAAQGVVDFPAPGVPDPRVDALAAG